VTLLHGWGHHPVIEAHTETREDLSLASEHAVLSRGLGRAYGDAALTPRSDTGTVSVTTRANRVLSFDAQTGFLRAEAGLSLSDLAHTYLPRGFFTPVSPGTQYVTLGGMVAADIHGKNHHVDGTFGRHVRQLTMRVGDGRVLTVSRDQEPELFAATLGGMGLTGHILDVEVQLAAVPSPWLVEESERFGSTAAVFDALNAASESWPMTVAWIDTSIGGPAAGRGIVVKGRWATPQEAPEHPPGRQRSIRVPPIFPSGVMNRATIRGLNTLWYRKHPRRPVHRVVSPGHMFWQLDLATEWYRGYGKRGFTQYQCIMPRDLGVYERFLALFRGLGGSSFVTVFKDCGEAGEGLLSFPMRGTSLALDIPITTVEAATAMVRELNAFVIDHGGRVYLAKDAFTTAGDLRRMYPQIDAFQAVRARFDPEQRIRSALGKRLLPRQEVKATAVARGL